MIGIGKYVGEMAEWLARQGHEVRVIAAPPYYPQWRVDAKYSKKWYSKETVNDVKIYRAPLYVPRKATGIRRIIHLVSFAFTSIPLLLRQISWRPDLMFVTEPPIFCAPNALIFSKLGRVRSWLHVQDYEVSAGFNLGLLKGRFLKRVILGVEAWLMKRFDRVSSISVQMVRMASAKIGRPESALLFPNWVDTKQIAPLTAQSTYRASLGIPEEKIVALYSGSISVKQGVGLLADAMRLLQHDKRLVFVVAGSGVMKGDLMRRCEGLASVRFLDLQPASMLGEFLGLADIHLLPQRADAADLVLPSKLTGMLASGRPIVATAGRDTDLWRLVQNCGLAAEPEDAADLARCICSLADQPELRQRMGEAGRRFAESNLSIDAILGSFEQEAFALTGCVSRQSFPAQ